MKQVAIAVALSLTTLMSAPAFAKANCKAYPKSEWMSEADAKASFRESLLH